MKKQETLKSVVANVARGYCMGTADVVPGVSGGTIALLSGIYARLIQAISHFDLELVKKLKQRKWVDALAHIDFFFLAPLAGGIGAGIVLTTILFNSLLSSDQTRPYAFAIFFGMILASGLMVMRNIKLENLQQAMMAISLAILGGCFAVWLTSLTPSPSEDGPMMAYLFFCGTIAICAMILPGISGAFILLILGVYGHLTAIPHQLIEGDEVMGCLISLVVFGAGCATGLLSFSKLLRWLLENHLQITMAVLCGLMFGSLPKLWPFQTNLTPEIKEFKHQLLEAHWPPIDRSTISVYAVAIAAAVAVLTVFFIVERRIEQRVERRVERRVEQ